MKKFLPFVCIAAILSISGCSISDNVQKLYVRAEITDSPVKTITKSETAAFSSDNIGVYVDDASVLDNVSIPEKS